MKKIRHILTIIIVFSMAGIMCGVNLNSDFVQAKQSKKVTLKEQKNITKLCKNFETFLGLQLLEEDPDLKIKVGKTEEWLFQKWDKEDLTYKYNMIVPLWYMGIKKAPQKVFGIDGWEVHKEVGDWGEQCPYIALKKITKVSSNKYYAKFDICWKFSGPFVKKEKNGEAKFLLKKKSNSYYGFIVKKVKIKKTAEV